MNNFQSTTIDGLDSYTGIVKGNYWQLGLTNSCGIQNGIPLSYTPSRHVYSRYFLPLCAVTMTIMKTINLKSNYDCRKGNGLINRFIWKESLAFV